MRIDLPLDRIGADEANRARGVFKHPRMMIALRTEPVFDDERSNSICDQPIGIALAFVRRERAITAARQNHDGSARGDAWGAWKKRGEARDVFVFLAQRAGRTIRPERNG